MGYEIDKNLIKDMLLFPCEIEVLDSVSSTNDYVKDKDLFCVIAKEQTGGKGTNNRSFFSPLGGIYLSVKLNLNLKGEDFLLLTPYVAVLTARAIDKVSGAKTSVKWVNDIYLNGKKLAGILCENLIVNETAQVVVGIGVNVDTKNFPAFNLNVPTSLANEGYNVDKNRLIAELLNSFSNFEKGLKSREFLTEYGDRFYLKGKDVTITQNGKTVKGRVKGISKTCAVKVQTECGEKEFYFGDVIVDG
ncbi:MAG: biotin--[acetyl-CoA-carboxylase] ligase [Clostridia bacterium]|nr:biotin--[acetyl-CoA-carboxylase] ligase [Clostridia bacterium]